MSVLVCLDMCDCLSNNDFLCLMTQHWLLLAAVSVHVTVTDVFSIKGLRVCDLNIHTRILWWARLAGFSVGILCAGTAALGLGHRSK